MRIDPGERQCESKVGRMGFQPGKRGRLCKSFGQGFLIGDPDVDGPSGVVFTVSGSGHFSKDIPDRLSRRQLGADDLHLALDASKSGNRHQGDAGFKGFIFHICPRLRCRCRKPDVPSFGIFANGNELSCLGLNAEPAFFPVIRRYAERTGHCHLRRTRQASVPRRSPPGSPSRRR